MRTLARASTLPRPHSAWAKAVGSRGITTLATVDEYKQLRIYKNKTTFDLLFNYGFNKACQYDLFLNNVGRMYYTSRFLLGKRLSALFVRHTVARIFTAGDNLTSLKDVCESLNQKGMGTMIDYCSEAIHGKENLEAFFDHNAEYFVKSIEVAADGRGNSVAIKASGLLPLAVLKQLNAMQLKIDALVADIFVSRQETTNIGKIADALRKRKVEFSEAELRDFVCSILGRAVEAEESISWIELKSNFYAFYVGRSDLNKSSILMQLVQFDEGQRIQLSKMEQRLDRIFESSDRKNVKLMIDAEQSYLQTAIDVLTQQYQNRFNRNRVLIYNTIQNYLKESQQRIEFEIERSRFLDTPFALKMVRGAYMREEGMLAKKNGYENPVHNSYQDTEANYHNNIIKLLKSMNAKSELMIASHNERTILLAEGFLESAEARPFHKNNVAFAQLYGLADQITHKLLSQGYTTCKYVPFGEMEIMIPYLLRRAQETKDMLGSVHIQAQLIRHELQNRIL